MNKNRLIIITVFLFSLSTIFAQNKKNIPYTIAKNYFVKNTFQDTDLKSYKILTTDSFNKFLGMATVMGNEGKPTEIDFTKQFIIIVVHDITDIMTKLNPEKLTITGKRKLTFKFDTKIGEKLTFTIRPFTMIIVDKKYKNYKIELETHSVL